MSGTILLADDSLTIQKVVELTFADTDFEVVAVSSGEELLQKIPECQPDVIICDVIMPGMDGYSVCQQIKSSATTLHIPVVLLTGTFEPFDRDRALAAGCSEIITKPFEARKLVESVEQLVRGTGDQTIMMEAEEHEGAMAPPPPIGSGAIGVMAGAAHEHGLDFTTTGFDEMEALSERDEPLVPPPPPDNGLDFTTTGFDAMERAAIELGDAQPTPLAAAPAPPAFEQPTSEPSFPTEEAGEALEEVFEVTGTERSAPAEAAAEEEYLPGRAGSPDEAFGEEAFAAADEAAVTGPAEASTDEGPPTFDDPSAESPVDSGFGYPEQQSGDLATSWPVDPSPYVAPETVPEPSSQPEPSWHEEPLASAADTWPETPAPLDDTPPWAEEGAVDAAPAAPWPEADAPAPPMPAEIPEPWTDEPIGEDLATGAETVQLGSVDLSQRFASTAAPLVEQPPEPEATADEAWGAEAEPEAPVEIPAPVTMAAPVVAAGAQRSLSDEDVDRIARRMLELAGDAIERIAWEVVPDMAEVVVRERLRELEAEVERSID